jgi:hypothetical protein
MMSASMVRTGLAGSIAVALALSACLGDFLDPLDQPGLAVVFLPADTAVYVGTQYLARAQMLNRFGDLYDSDHIGYSGPDPIAEVSQAGSIKANAVGRARVIARRSDLVDTGWVSVVPPGRVALVLRTEQQSRLRSSELDGSGLQSVADVGALGEGAPAWLPSGTAIVHQDGDFSSSVLYITDLAGNRTRLLSPDPQYVDERYPRPSRDGLWIYFRRATSFGAGEIWRVHPDGTGVEPVVPVPFPNAGDTHPDPAPDGNQLVFVSGRFGGPIELVVRNLTTGVERTLGDNGLLPRWSPQGDWIAYWKGNEFTGGALYAARPDGTEFRRISLPDRIYRPQALDWSSDGEWLLAKGDSTMELVQVATGMALPLAFTQPYHWASLRP